MTRSNVIIANQVLTGTGTDAASRPSVAFGDSDTGFYELTDDKLSVSLGGTERFHFSGSEFTKADGTPFITSAATADDSILDKHVSGQAGINLTKLMQGTQGQVLFYNSASQISGLAVGTSGQYLMTQGAGQNPVYTSVPSTAGAMTRRYEIGWTVRDISATEFFQVGNHSIAAGEISTNGMIFIRGSLRNSGVGSASPIFKMRYNSNSVNNQYTGPNGNVAGTGEVRYEMNLARAPIAKNSTTLWGWQKITTGASTEIGLQNATHTGAGDALAEAANIIFEATGHGQPSMSGMIEIFY